MSQIKLHNDLPQGKLPQREEILRKTVFVFMRTDLTLDYTLHREKKE
jgi:hypothetical protein